jgi:hypothetical protein
VNPRQVADQRPLYLRFISQYRDDIVACWDEDGEYCPDRCEIPREVQLLWAASYCEADTCNGGFHQFFSNPTGFLAPEAVIGFELIGLPECADVLKRAMAFFGEPYPRLADVRNAKLYAVQRDPNDWNRETDDPFVQLDAEFYDCLKVNSFNSAANEYVERIASHWRVT